MATATKTQTVTEITLKLTHEEARVLGCLLAAVGGREDTTARKYTERIAGALNCIGYYWDATLITEGSVRFLGM